MDYDQKFDDDWRHAFTEVLRADEEKVGAELWCALANVKWIHRDDPNQTDCGHSFRSAGALIASMLCKGDYMDWYCSGPDATVSEFVSTEMTKRGWRFEFYY